jgi:hypothetical protein
MVFYTLSNIRSTLASQAPKTCPDIYLAFLELDECDQEWVLASVQTVSARCRNMGPVSGLELLYKLGYFLNQNVRRCPCCGQVMDKSREVVDE